MKTNSPLTRCLKSLSLLILLALWLIGQPLRAASQNWTGGSVVDGNWSTIGNWSGGAAPGSTSLTTSTDVATFDAAIANTWGNAVGNPIVIDSATQNIRGITFTGAAGNYFIGSTGGNALKLTSGGTIQIANTLTASNAVETINAPLALQGTSYTFTNNSANGSGAGAGTLNFGGGITGVTGSTVLLLNGSNTNANTISGIIGNGAATSVGFTKNGTGTWVLTGANTFSGLTTIGDGTLSINSIANSGVASPLGAGSTILLGINNGTNNAKLQFTGASGGSSNRGISLINNGSSGGGTIENTVAGQTLTLSGAVGINNNPATNVSLGLTGAGDGVLSGTISNQIARVSMTKSGTGTWTFSGTNTYSGDTTVSGGTLKIANTRALGFGGVQTTTTGNTAVNSGFTLDLNGTTGINEPITLNGTGIGGNGALVNNSGTPASIANGIAGLAVPATGIGSGLSAAPAVVISGTGTGATATASLGLTTASITSVSGGTGWVTGDTVSFLGGSGAVGTVTASGGAITAITITSAGRGYTTAPTTVLRVTGAGNTAGVTLTGNATNFTVGGLTLTNAGSNYTGTPTVTVGGLGGATPTLSSVHLATDSSIGGSGNMTISSVVSGAGLTKVGAGTLTLSAANTYTGATNVSAGMLQVNNTLASATYGLSGGSLAIGASNLLPNTSAVTLTGGTLAMGNFDNTAASVSLQSGSITGTGGTLTSTTAFDVQSGAVSAKLGGSAGLTKTTGGTVTLAGVNTFTGKTTIANGTLSVSNVNVSATANQALGANTDLDLGVAATSSGRLVYTGAADTLAKNINVLGNGTDTIENSGTGLLTLSGTLNKSGTTLTLKGGANGLTVSGVIAGAAAGSNLIIDGGTTTLTNTNTYNGTTTVSAGMLQAATPGALPGYSSAGQVSVAAAAKLAVNVGGVGQWTGADVDTLRTNASFAAGSSLGIDTTGASLSYGSNIGGTLGLTKLGTNTLTLTGTNTYTGQTIVNGGTLTLNNTSGIAIAGSGAKVKATPSASVIDVVINSGGTLRAQRANQFASSVAIQVNTGGTLNLTKSQTLWNLTSSGTVTYGRGATIVITDPDYHVGSTNDIFANLSLGVLNVHGGTNVIHGDEGYGASINGDGNPAPGSLTILNGQGGLVFTTAGANLTVSSDDVAAGKLILQDNIVSSQTSGVTSITNGFKQTYDEVNDVSVPTVNYGSLNGQLDLDGATRSITVTHAAATLLVSADVINGGITKEGAGVLQLSGVNSYAGATTVNAGTLQADTTSALPGFSSPGQVSVASTATLAVNVGGVGQWTSADLDTLRTNASFAAGSSLGIDTTGASLSYGSNIGGSLGLTKLGANTLTLTGASTYSGATLITGGTLQIGSGSTTGSLSPSSVITNNASLVFNRSDTVTQGTDFGSGISGTGTVTQAGSGTLVLNSTNSYSGATIVSAGTLEVTANNALGTNAAGTSVTNGAALKLTNVNYSTTEAVSLNGTGISNGGALVNSGTSTLAGQVTAATNASINAGGGTLTLTGGLVKNGTAATIMGGGRVNITGTGISGSNPNSDLVVDGTTVVVSAASNYNGPTNVQNSGTFVANAAITTSAVTVSSNSTLSGTGSIQNGAGLVIMNGALVVGDSTLGSPVASQFEIGGTGNIEIGGAGTVSFDLFTGAGLGDSTASLAAADRLLVVYGNLNAASGAKLVISNPSLMTGFAWGDMWTLVDLGGSGAISGTFVLDYSALGPLGPGLVGQFDNETGVFSIVPEPSRALLLMAGLTGVLLRRRRK